HRARVGAARAALPAAADPAAQPLARLMSAHDALTARWMAYETDPGLLIVFPTMTDARVPTTATFLAEQRAVRELRPASAHTRLTTAQFAAYRDGVARLGRAFDAAEAEAWRRARASGAAPPVPTRGDPDAADTTRSDWSALAQTVIERSTAALSRGAGSAQAAPSPAGPGPETSATGPTRSSATPPRSSPPTPVWPVPARDRRSTQP
ncbi:MAG: hypothetical protein QM622_09675, partial [Microbacterium sp.]